VGRGQRVQRRIGLPQRTVQPRGAAEEVRPRGAVGAAPGGSDVVGGQIRAAPRTLEQLHQQRLGCRMARNLPERVADERLGLGLVAERPGMELRDLDQRGGTRIAGGQERNGATQPPCPRRGVTAASGEIGELGGGVHVGSELECAGERGAGRGGVAASLEEERGPAPLDRGRVGVPAGALQRAPETGESLQRLVGPVGPGSDLGHLFQREGAERDVSLPERGVGGGLERREQHAAAPGLAVERGAGLVRDQRVGERGGGAEQQPLGQLGIRQLRARPLAQPQQSAAHLLGRRLAELVRSEQLDGLARVGAGAQLGQAVHRGGRGVGTVGQAAQGGLRLGQLSRLGEEIRVGEEHLGLASRTAALVQRGDHRGEERQRLCMGATGVERERELRQLVAGGGHQRVCLPAQGERRRPVVRTRGQLRRLPERCRRAVRRQERREALQEGRGLGPRATPELERDQPLQRARRLVVEVEGTAEGGLGGLAAAQALVQQRSQLGEERDCSLARSPLGLELQELGHRRPVAGVLEVGAQPGRPGVPGEILRTRR
jgi:hypothetical protein